MSRCRDDWTSNAKYIAVNGHSRPAYIPDIGFTILILSTQIWHVIVLETETIAQAACSVKTSCFYKMVSLNSGPLAIIMTIVTSKSG